MQELAEETRESRLDLEALVCGPSSVGGFSFSPDGRTLAFSWTKEGGSQIHVARLSRFVPRQLTDSPGACGSPSWSPDGMLIAFSESGDGCRIRTIDPRNGTCRTLLDLAGDSCSDLAWSPDGSHNAWSPLIQLLQNRGFLVMAPNFRGSIGYGREFCDLKKGDWAGGDLKDVVAAADWLESAGLADGSRIALLGGSYGGYLTLMTLAGSQRKWAAGVDLFGFVNLVTFYDNAPDYVRLMIAGQIGTPAENSDFFRDRSPINNCDAFAAPLLILHGAGDRVVPVSESRQMAERLRSLGKTCELKELGGDHSIHGTRGQIEYMKATLEFLDRHVNRPGIP